MELVQNNAIPGVPTPGLCYIHNYFSHTHTSNILCQNHLSFHRKKF